MFKLLTAIFGLASASINPDDNTCESHRSCWSAAEIKYFGDWPSCRSDGDCEPDYHCLSHMWTYN